jgi:hypothetical protein
MRVAIYDRVEPAMPADMPIHLNQTCSQRTAAVMLSLVVPVIIGAAFAAFAIVQALLSPAVRMLIGQHPVQALEILFAVGFLIFLIALPAKRMVDRLASTRTVDIGDGMVTVTEGGYFHNWTWSAPLSSYNGVAHHMRASLSGARHELILVHPVWEKSILLSVAPRTSQSEVERVAALLGHKQIPPAELYRFKGLWPRMHTAPLPDAAHA